MKVNIYIKDSRTKKVYGRIRNTDMRMFEILHSLLSNAGCLYFCSSNFLVSPAVSMEVDDCDCDMHDYIKDVLRNARILYKRLFGVD